MSLTARDIEILRILALKVRVLSVRQTGRTWWAETANPIGNARTRMRRLAQGGWVHPVDILARPEILLKAPLCTWKPKDPDPDFGALSYRLKTRWNTPAVRTSIVLASVRTGQQFGGRGGRLPRRSEQTHDLHLATVFLVKRKTDPKSAKRWQSEDLIPKRSGRPAQKLPDAIIQGRSPKAIECGGEYSKAKLTEFHAYCKEQHLPYEIW